MSWNTLQAHAKKMGFEVAFRTRRDEQGGFMPDLTPPDSRGWILVGSYDHVAGFWVRPLSNGAAKLDSGLIRRLMTDYDPFIGTFADGDVDCFDANRPLPLESQNIKRRSVEQNDTDSLGSATIKQTYRPSVLEQHY